MAGPRFLSSSDRGGDAGLGPVESVGERIETVPAARLGEVLRSARRDAGRSIADTSRTADIPQRWLYWVEEGRYRANAEMVTALLNCYRTTIDRLLPPHRPLQLGDGLSTPVGAYLEQLTVWRPPSSAGLALRRADLAALAALTETSPERLARNLRLAATGGPLSSRWAARRLR